MGEETIHHGQGVSTGIAYGPAYLIKPDTLRVPRREVPGDEVEEEVERLRAAMEKARADIRNVQEVLGDADKAAEAAIFDAHLLILEDPEMFDAVVERIRAENVNAEHAFRERMWETSNRLERSDNAYLRERVRDLRDVEHRVIRTLLGEREPAVGDLMQNAILVAHDLPPSLTAELDRDRILGFATEVGAPNSHTAILARALEIPAVIDLGPILGRLEHGESIVLDGREGLLVQNPSHDTLAEYDRLRAKIERRRTEWISLAEAPGVTADGTQLTFLANIDFPREVDAALAFGCEGIGLYRTEYLFLQAGGEPPEDDQHAAYRDLVDRMEGRPVTIRTVDLGGDKLLSGMEAEDNPFLGWRAIRYCLDRPEMFRAQLRAILRAGVGGPIRIMFPMITSLEEADRALEHLAEVREELEEEGIPHAAECSAGALIETPGAALLARPLAERFDFLSLGTNDLIQYTLAVDRGNRRIAHLFQPFHPAILRLIDIVTTSAEEAGCEVTVCGEMGSNSRAAVLLLGLGVRSFSMVPARIPRIKQVLGRIAVDEARDAVEAALAASRADEAQKVVTDRFADRFRHRGRNDDEGGGE